MAEIIKLYQEFSSVKDLLIQFLKENHAELSVVNDDYVKSLKQNNMLNQKIAILERDAIKYKRLSSSKKILHPYIIHCESNRF